MYSNIINLKNWGASAPLAPLVYTFALSVLRIFRTTLFWRLTQLKVRSRGVKLREEATRQLVVTQFVVAI